MTGGKQTSGAVGSSFLRCWWWVSLFLLFRFESVIWLTQFIPMYAHLIWIVIHVHFAARAQTHIVGLSSWDENPNVEAGEWWSGPAQAESLASWEKRRVEASLYWLSWIHTHNAVIHRQVSSLIMSAVSQPHSPRSFVSSAVELYFLHIPPLMNNSWSQTEKKGAQK